MKRGITIFFVLTQLLFNSCEENNAIERIWITDKWHQCRDCNEYHLFKKKIAQNKEEYSVAFQLHVDSMYNSIINDTQIFQFDGDSLIITYFNNTLYYGYDRYVFRYDYERDSILINNDQEENLSFKVDKLTGSKLVLSYSETENHLSENTLTFQSVNKFDCPISMDSLKSYISNSEFLLDKTNTEICFQGYEDFSGKISINELQAKFKLKTNDNWHLAKVENELFLIVGSEAIQIIGIKGNKIIGYIYGDLNKRVLLEKMI